MPVMTKKLKDLVRKSTSRNSDLISNEPQGINIDKRFMPSVANINGVDLSKYKVVQTGQFACNRMHVGRDERLPIAINHKKPIIVSPAYDVFEVTDSDVLPEYLMMYFKSNSFDKECWFYTDADIRGALIADSFYDISIPILDIKTQKIITKLFSIIDKKIQNAIEQNSLLSKAAETFYKNQFGGRMIGDNKIGDYILPKRGKTLLASNARGGNIPVVAGGIEPSAYHNIANTLSPVITISASGANAGYINLWETEVWSSDSSYIDKSVTDSIYFWYVTLKSRQKEIYDAQIGSAQAHVYPQHIADMEIGEISTAEMKDYSEKVSTIFKKIKKNNLEIQKFSSIKDRLLTVLTSMSKKQAKNERRMP